MANIYAVTETLTFELMARRSTEELVDTNAYKAVTDCERLLPWLLTLLSQKQ